MILANKILSVTGIVFIAIQFFRPAHNKSRQVFATDISKIVTTSDSVMAVLINACYDCHSNNITYPWYSDIQPVGWLIAKHIRKGKEELNFSEFGNYAPRRQLSKLNGIANSIRDNNMPLASYKILHKKARLSINEKAILINWAQQSKDTLSTKN